MLHVFEVAERLKPASAGGDRRQHRSVTAGEPLKLLEEKAGLQVAEVTKILRQEGDYKKAAEALSEGRTGEAFEELDKLGWIKEVPDEERNKQLADAYLSAAAEKNEGRKAKSALVVSPTHAEADRITQAIRDGLKAQGKLGEERIVTAWIPAHLTDAQKADPTQYDPGDMVQFHQNATGYKKGVTADVAKGQAARRAGQAVRGVPADQLALAVGDRVRITAGGKTKDGKHRLSNGVAVSRSQGFTKRGDMVVDHGWVIDRDFGHLTHGYAMTSHASQGMTVDKVFIGMSERIIPGDHRAYRPMSR